MDAAGKDSAIKSVFEGVNPQGCEVTSFKQPTSKELDHDFLWRCMIALPERGRIGIFNRSHYEECLVTRVHPKLLQDEKIPPSLITKKIWHERFEDIMYVRHISDLCIKGLSGRDRLIRATGAHDAVKAAPVPEKLKAKLTERIDAIIDRFLVDEQIIVGFDKGTLEKALGLK